MDDYTLPLGSAEVLVEGSHVTVVAWGAQAPSPHSAGASTRRCRRARPAPTRRASRLTAAPVSRASPPAGRCT